MLSGQIHDPANLAALRDVEMTGFISECREDSLVHWSDKELQIFYCLNWSSLEIKNFSKLAFIRDLASSNATIEKRKVCILKLVMLAWKAEKIDLLFQKTNESQETTNLKVIALTFRREINVALGLQRLDESNILKLARQGWGPKRIRNLAIELSDDKSKLLVNLEFNINLILNYNIKIIDIYNFYGLIRSDLVTLLPIPIIIELQKRNWNVDKINTLDKDIINFLGIKGILKLIEKNAGIRTERLAFFKSPHVTKHDVELAIDLEKLDYRSSQLGSLDPKIVKILGRKRVVQLVASGMPPGEIDKVDLVVIFTWGVELVIGLSQLKWNITDINDLQKNAGLKQLTYIEILTLVEQGVTSNMMMKSSIEITQIDAQIPSLIWIDLITEDGKNMMEFVVRIKLLLLIAQGQTLQASVNSCRKGLEVIKHTLRNFAATQYDEIELVSKIHMLLSDDKFLLTTQSFTYPIQRLFAFTSNSFKEIFVRPSAGSKLVHDLEKKPALPSPLPL